MTSFLLVRHAEPDYTNPRRWDTLGWGADLASLTIDGERHAHVRALELLKWNPQIVLCSPTTRTMQTALIFRQFIDAPFQVEFDLHEWVPDKSFMWKTYEEILCLIADMENCKYEWPAGQEKPWEPYSSVRSRVTAVLSRYTQYDRVMVVCHGVVIRSLTGRTMNEEIGYVEAVPFDLG